MSGEISIQLNGALSDGRRPSFAYDFEAAIPVSGITVVFGKSGSGKSTLLRCIAGFQPSLGTLTFGDTVWQDKHHSVRASQRRIGYVFQRQQLFPHMSIAENLRFSESRRGGEAPPLAREDLIDLFQLDHLLSAMPNRLSGGEQQRVAIVRALLNAPRLLLLDEPLSALDQERRQQVISCLLTVARSAALPMIYVSHSLREASALANHLLLVDQGSVTTSAASSEILTDVRSVLATRPDANAIVDGVITEIDTRWQLAKLRAREISLWMPTNQHMVVGEAARALIPAANVSLTKHRDDSGSMLNQLDAEVTDIIQSDHSAHVTVRLLVGQTILLAQITKRSLELLGLHPGMLIVAQVKALAVQ
ncbi:MAG: molybdenum ABC transporter ATP-binding protein [Woeseiaceae bacterium]